LGETRYSCEQKLVDEYFDAQSALWRNIYQERNIRGLIIRQRQAVALKYVDELSLPKTSPVLEIGCGAGFLALALARRGFTVEAVDHVLAMVELTRRHVRQAGMESRVHVAVEDVHELSFEDESFDLVVSLGVINWLHDLRRALGEITRVLKPGAYAVLNSAGARVLFNPLAIGTLEYVLDRMKDGLERVVPHSSRGVALSHMYLPVEINQYFREANLMLIKSTIVGFGPFRIFNHDIFSHDVEAVIQQKLQQYVDRGCPVLALAAGQYIAVVRKR
jgi:ubiquinone/menaquinone biosynthesis C-methylase UbiE